MSTAELNAAPEAAPPASDLLQIIEQHPQPFSDDGTPPRTAAARACIADKHFPYARIDRNTVRRTKRLGPALSLSTTRQVYPDEDAAASIAV
jgi:hypothetical protein